MNNRQKGESGKNYSSSDEEEYGNLNVNEDGYEIDDFVVQDGGEEENMEDPQDFNEISDFEYDEEDIALIQKQEAEKRKNKQRKRLKRNNLDEE